MTDAPNAVSPEQLAELHDPRGGAPESAVSAGPGVLAVLATSGVHSLDVHLTRRGIDGTGGRVDGRHAITAGHVPDHHGGRASIVTPTRVPGDVPVEVTRPRATDSRGRVAETTIPACFARLGTRLGVVRGDSMTWRCRRGAMRRSARTARTERRAAASRRRAQAARDRSRAARPRPCRSPSRRARGPRPASGRWPRAA